MLYIYNKAMPPISDSDVEDQDNYQLDINTYNIKKAAAILRSIDHKLRQEIIITIHEKKSITVTQLYTMLQIEQPVASQHLAILRRARIVTILRQGKHRYYSLNPARIDEIKDFAKGLVG
jgi:ArsR family transcriptional regulator, virulence genes transcriptional regulator